MTEGVDTSQVRWDDEAPSSSTPAVDLSRVKWDEPAKVHSRGIDLANVKWDDAADFSDVRSSLEPSYVAPIGDSAPDFGSGQIQPGEMEAAGKEFRRIGGIGAQAAGARALNLGALFQQGMNPGESIAAQVAGLPDEVTQPGQMRRVARDIAPHVDPGDIGGRFAETVGGFAPDVAAAAATGGMAELPAGAGILMRGLHGAMSMSLPAAENTREAYNRSITSGLTPFQAAEQAAIAGGGTLAMGAIPANVPGNLAERFASGAGIAAAQTETQRRAANALLPENKQDLAQPLDPTGLGLSALTGGVMAAALGRGGIMDRGSEPLPGKSAQELVLDGQPPSSGTDAPPALQEQAATKPFSRFAGDSPETTNAQVVPEHPSALGDVQRLASARIAELENRPKPNPFERFELRILRDNRDSPTVLAEALGLQLPEFEGNGGEAARQAGESPTSSPSLTEEAPNAAQEATGPVAEPNMQSPANTSRVDESLPDALQRISEPTPLDTATTNKGNLSTEGEAAASEPDARNLFDRATEQGDRAARSDAALNSLPRDGAVDPRRVDDAMGVWRALAEHDDAFRYPQSDKKSLPDLWRQTMPDYPLAYSHALAEGNIEPADHAWKVHTPDGQEAAVFRKGNDVWIDVSELQQGQEGARIYAAVANWAHNAGLKFIGDPAGLSNVALKRRSEAMMSAALKAGTTDHLEPHPRQLQGNRELGVPPLKWRNGDHNGNLRSLMLNTHAVTMHEFPELRDVRYDANSGRFVRPDGSEMTDERFHKLTENKRLAAELAVSRSLGADRESLSHSQARPVREAFTSGRTSLARAVLTESALRGDGPQIRNALLAAKSGVGAESASGQSLRSLGLDRVLYSRDRDGAPADSAASIERLRNTLASDPRVGKSLRTLERTGALELVHDPHDQFAGRYDPATNKLKLNAAFAHGDDAFGTALHEAVHREVRDAGGLRAFVGPGEFDRLQGRLDVLKGEGGPAADLVRAAEARAQQSGESGARLAEERLAYFVEEARNAQKASTLPQRAGLILRQIASAIRAAVHNSKFGRWLESRGLGTKLTPDDFVALAENALRRQARDVEQGSVPVHGDDGSPAYASVPDEAVSNDVKRATAHVPGELVPATSSRLGSALSAAVGKLLPVKNPVREVVRNDVRSALAQRDRAIGTFDKATRAYLKYYDKQLRMTRKSPLLAMKDAIAFEKGKPIPDPNTRPFFAYMRKMLDAQAEQIQSYGKGFLDHLVTDYFPHSWQDPDAAAKFYGAALARRPLGGRREFTRERVIDSLEDGIKAGMRPTTLNPAELVLQRYASGEKLLTQLKIMDALEKRGLVQKVANGGRVPRGFAYVDDRAFGNRAVPDFVARDLNNYLDPGLTRFAAWRGFRWLQNFTLSVNLGFSAFHAGMTTIDTIATHADIGWRRMALLGDLKGGLRELANMPVAVFKSPFEGGKLVKQFYGQMASDPNTSAILNMLTEGGGRGYMHPTDINDSFTKLLRAYDQGNAAGVAFHALPGLIEGTSRLISHKLVPAQKMVARVMHAKFRLDEVADALGKRNGDYAGIVDAMNPDALRNIAHEINSTIDDRLGQFAYDNLFWNKTFRDFLHATVQSVGWNFGTLRLLLGGMKDTKGLVAPEHYDMPLDKEGKLANFQKSRLSDRLSYLITLNAVVGMAGATLQYMMTGDGPKELRDFFFPRTGRKNTDGSDERLSFPSYVKDEFEFARHPLETAQHKLHPIFSHMLELGRNRDFYGTRIYDPDADIPSEAKDVLTYLGKSFTPYSVRGAMKSASTGANAAMTALPFIGITPAPASITHSEFQDFVMHGGTNGWPSIVKTPEQEERKQTMRAASAALRNGTDPDYADLSEADIEKVQSDSDHSVPELMFKRLPNVDKIKAWDLATAHERDEYHLRDAIEGMHLEKSKPFQRLAPAEQDRLRQKVRDILAGASAQ